MKKLSVLLILLSFSWPLLSQDRDSLLKQINQIKKDTETYLYGLSTVPDEPDSQISLDQARAELDVQIKNFLNEGEFPYLKEKQEVPGELIQSVSCLLRPDCYRSLVYVKKSALQELENALAEQLGSDTRKEALEKLVQDILAAQTINEVLDRIAASSLAGEVRAAQKIDNQTQQYANDGLLVYFDPKTKKVQEVMTPMDASFTRKNAKTGAPAQPVRYKNAPLWIYVEGLKNSIEL